GPESAGACNCWATMPPRSRPWRAISGTPTNAADHAPDEDPGGHRAGRFSPRHRWTGTALSGTTAVRSVCRRRLRLPQSQSDGAEGVDVRRPGVLALPQAALPGSFPVVAVRRGRSRPAISRAPTVGVAGGRQSDRHGGGPRLASGRPTDLILLRTAGTVFFLPPFPIAAHFFSWHRHQPLGRGRA